MVSNDHQGSRLEQRNLAEPSEYQDVDPGNHGYNDAWSEKCSTGYCDDKSGKCGLDEGHVNSTIEYEDIDDGDGN